MFPGTLSINSYRKRPKLAIDLNFDTLTPFSIPGIKVVDTISKSKRLLLLFHLSRWNFVLKYSNVIF